MPPAGCGRGRPRRPDARDDSPVVDGILDRSVRAACSCSRSSSTSTRKRWPSRRSCSRTPWKPCRTMPWSSIVIRPSPVPLPPPRRVPPRAAATSWARKSRAAIECGDGSADRSRVGADRRGGVAEHPASVLLRERPTSTGRPIRRAGRGHESARGSGRASCRSRSPGRGRRDLGNPGRHREREPLLEKAGDLLDDVVVTRGELHRARLPLHVHQANVRARVGDRTRELGVAAQGGDVVDEQRAAPRACRATSALEVSIETGMPASCSSTGSTRRNSSSTVTASAPGRVDSPPMSIRAAPFCAEPPGRCDGDRRVEVARRRPRSCRA